MEEEDSSMLTETYMMGIGRMTKLTALVNIPTLTEPSTRAIGSMISNMEKEKKSGLTVQNTKVNINSERRMDSETLAGLISQATMETL